MILITPINFIRARPCISLVLLVKWPRDISLKYARDKFLHCHLHFSIWFTLCSIIACITILLNTMLNYIKTQRSSCRNQWWIQVRGLKYHYCEKKYWWFIFHVVFLIVGQSNIMLPTCIYGLSNIPCPWSVKHDHLSKYMLVLTHYHSYDNE